MTPAEITPVLRTERLQLLAGEIKRVRLDARDVFQPEKGDNAWSFGCLCYVRTCAALSQLEASKKYPWLRIDVDGLACTIFVDGEPIKFYTGDPKRPSDRSLRHEQAISQGKLPFMEDEYAAMAEGWFWLMAIDTIEDGTVGQIVFLQTNRNGDIRHSWFVPLDEPVLVAASVSAQRREGVDLEPPAVGVKRPAAKKRTSAAGTEDDGA